MIAFLQSYYYWIAGAALALGLAIYRLRYKILRQKYEAKKLDVGTLQRIMHLNEKANKRKQKQDQNRAQNLDLNTFDPDDPWRGVRKPEGR